MNLAEIEFLAERERIIIKPTFTSESYKFIEACSSESHNWIGIAHNCSSVFCRAKLVHSLPVSRHRCRCGSRSIWNNGSGAIFFLPNGSMQVHLSCLQHICSWKSVDSVHCFRLLRVQITARCIHQSDKSCYFQKLPYDAHTFMHNTNIHSVFYA